MSSSSLVFNLRKGKSSASNNNGESRRLPICDDEETRTSSSSGSSRNLPVIDKDTRLLFLPGYGAKDKYVLTTRAGPSSNDTYFARSYSREYQCSAEHLALPVETCGELMHKADLKHQHLLKARDDELNDLRDKLYDLQVKLEASRERENALKDEWGRYIISVVGGHDYNSTFPSPSDLIKRVNSFNEGMFADVMETMENVGHSVIQHTLVDTVRQCHALAQFHVKVRLDALDTFLLGKDPPQNSHDAEKPAYVKDIAGGAFRKVFRFMFGHFYPSEGIKSGLLDVVKDEVKKNAQSDIQVILTSSFQTEGEIYDECIMKLLQTFLECELTRPKPLKFSDSFGSVQSWNKSLHNNVDPSALLDTEGDTDVQVILPGLYQAEGTNDTEPKKFETKPVVIRCESSPSAGGDESRIYSEVVHDSAYSQAMYYK